MLAEKKYPGVANGLERIRVKLTSGSGPSTHGATVSLFGASRQPFASGQGRCIFGI